MAAAIHNFFIEQGSNFELIFEYLDNNSNPIVINNNDCIRLKFKDNNDRYRAWKNDSTSNGSLLTRNQDPTLTVNQIKFFLPSTVTKTFLFDTAVYALDLVINGEESKTVKLAVGQISIIKDIFLTECGDGTVGDGFKTCKDCTAIVPADSESVLTDVLPPTPSPNANQLVTPTPSPSFGSTPTPTPTPSKPAVIEEDLCDYLCRGLDIYAQLYSGSACYINDATINSGINIPSVTSGSLIVPHTGVAKNIELYIDNLVHDNPSDLTMFLDPPSGDPILLSYRNKIANYNKQSGTKFAFSNKASAGTYLNNRSSNSDLYVNILQNSTIAMPSPYNTTYKYSFDHLLDGGAGSVSGLWNLYILDHDTYGSGYIGGWNLIITYEPPLYNENE